MRNGWGIGQVRHSPPSPDKTILVPLTNSLYVPGKLSDPDHVIVDVGTGYFVRKVLSLFSVQRSATDPCCIRVADTPPSPQVLFRESRLHPHKPRDTRRYDPEKTRQHELLD